MGNTTIETSSQNYNLKNTEINYTYLCTLIVHRKTHNSLKEDENKVCNQVQLKQLAAKELKYLLNEDQRLPQEEIPGRPNPGVDFYCLINKDRVQGF